MSTNPNDPCELLRRDPAAQNPSPYAAYELCGPLQQQPLQNWFGQSRLNDYNQQPYEPCGPALPIPTVHYAVRLSDEDVRRIAEAVVLRLRAEADYPRWRRFWRGFAALLDFGPYRPL